LQVHRLATLVYSDQQNPKQNFTKPFAVSRNPFGDAFEHAIEEYLRIKGCEILPKRFTNG